MTRKKVCVVGAGAKAAAIVARAAAMGEKAPEVIVVERSGIGAAWDGTSGFSDGDVLLCTPPAKDVGYPYAKPRRGDGTDADGPEAEVAKLFSWQAFLVDTGNYGEWIDRGGPLVAHAKWAAYLRWVFDRAGNVPVQGDVTRVRHGAAGWVVEYSTPGGLAQLAVDGVVVTGPGKARELELHGAPPPGRFLDSRTFFAEAERLRTGARHKTVAVIGAGGSAGAILAWLATALAGSAFGLRSISSNGTLFLRGDGFSERRHYTDPSDWPDIPVEVRREIMSRTEEGVISAQNRAVIDRCDRLEFHRGRAESVEWTRDEFNIERLASGKRRPLKADYVVSALGFDMAAYVLGLLEPDVARAADGADLRQGVGVDLSLAPAVAGPGLHVPGLADLAQGPGFATLGCLGLLAGRVLDPYVRT